MKIHARGTPLSFERSVGRKIEYAVRIKRPNLSTNSICSIDLCQWKYNGKKTNQIEKVNKIGAYVGLARHKSKQD